MIHQTTNPKPNILKNLFIIGSLLLAGCSQTVLVNNPEELTRAIQEARPGMTIQLSNGTWENIKIDFKGKGTEEKPITLTAEEKGKVFIEGESYLHLSGEYLVVSGLVFRNGHSASSELISFKTSDDELAYHCRLTECVIDDFSNIDRMAQDAWVTLYGKNNRVDHNHLEGKRNKGVTLIVMLNSEENQQNNHLIDHNYFGPRPVFGSNGAESMRLGTSTYSLTFSNTVVEYNYFDRCNGEVEIISNKSCGNTFRYNTFFESQGAFAFRHGHDNVAEGNVFIGNRVPNTGGIRVINENQTVRNNYFYGLTGADFRSALALMNGVPNSPLIRYNQVQNGKVENNTFINCDIISLGLGNDAERSLPPVNTTISKNVFYHDSRKDLFEVFDDVSGISFTENRMGAGLNPLVDSGFSNEKLTLSQGENGLFEVKGMSQPIGFDYTTPAVSREETGVLWYQPEISKVSSKSITVEPGKDALLKALAHSTGSTTLLLKPGNYLVSEPVEIAYPLTIRAADAGQNPVISFSGSSLFQLKNGGKLSLIDLEISGEKAEGAKAVITAQAPMNRNYKVSIDGCSVHDFASKTPLHFLDVDKTTFADSLVIMNSDFDNINGNILNLGKEDDDQGRYNAENILISNSSFRRIAGMVLNTYRGGKDESTFGPILKVSDCMFSQINNENKVSFELFGTQCLSFENSKFSNSAPIRFTYTVGRPEVQLTNSSFENTPAIISNIPINN